jgi:hypothetical protein
MGENLKRFKKDKPIKYLLLAEAPPWTEHGEEVRYFYSTFHTLKGSWCKSIWSAFCPSEKPPDVIEIALTQLAEQRFLLIDTLPYAMNYSKLKVRNKPEYKKLVEACLPFLMSKINNSNLIWDNDVKVALAFCLHGKAIIKALPDGLPLSNKPPIKLNEDLIATTCSHFTDSKKLRGIFGIKDI